jgi:ATP-dependent exoDNAse (exonuclease V) beta subunit
MSKTASPAHLVIRASAGTGKTYQLSSRYLRLLASGVAPDQILATTFTRKAAGEIQDRVLLRLAQAAADSNACRALAESIGDASFTPARAAELLAGTARQLHRLRVGTLDSYFLQVAQGFSLELGFPLGWSIGDELTETAVREEAVEQVLARGDLQELLTLLHLLAKGEATRGVSRIIHDTVRELFALYRQSTPDAWRKLPRPRGLSPEKLAETIAAIAAYPMPTSQWATAREKDLTSAAAADWTTFLEKGLAAKVLAGETLYYKKPIPADLAELYQKLLAHARSVLLNQLADQTAATHDLLARFGQQHEHLQSERRSLRFDDVAHKLSAASSIHAPDRLAFRLDGDVRHLLLDEFQDTSPVQWQVLRPLAQAITRTTGGSFFAVGDTKQAIYGWRGGVAEIFDALDIELTGLARQTLAQSYRSTPPVIDTVNLVFQNLTQHPNLDAYAAGVAQWQSRFPIHSTAKTDLPGYACLEFAPPPGADEDESEVLFRYAAEEVARHVQEAPQCSVGVLVRTNAAVARMIYLLRRHDIPASEEGGNPLRDSPAVELILSLLRLADHPGDRVARFHLASSPLAVHLDLSGHRDDRAAAGLARTLRRRLADEGYGAIIYDFARRLAPACDRRDQSRLQQLVELAYEYQSESSLRTDDFIEIVETRRIADPSSADVRVMTIHQAKGLEFDVVVLPELNGRLSGQPAPVVAGRPSPTEPASFVCRYASAEVQQLLPAEFQQLFDDDKRRSIAEDLCVLYVALTRAVHCLHMIVPAPKPNERTIPKTYAGLLRAALAGDTPPGASRLFAIGDPRWFTRLPPRTPDPHLAAEPAGEIRLAPPLAHRVRGLERTSPSSLEGGRVVSVARLLEPPPAAAFEFGTLIHAWMQEIEWLAETAAASGKMAAGHLPADARLKALAAQAAPGLFRDADLAAHIAAWRKQLAMPEVAKILRRSFYADPRSLGFGAAPPPAWKPAEITLAVENERSFAIRDGDELLSGSIDRLVLVRRGDELLAADVIDFKTDSLDPHGTNQLDDRVEHYRPQIEAYRRAVAKLYGLAPARIAARLVFLATGQVVSL